MVDTVAALLLTTPTAAAATAAAAAAVAVAAAAAVNLAPTEKQNQFGIWQRRWFNQNGCYLEYYRDDKVSVNEQTHGPWEREAGHQATLEMPCFAFSARRGVPISKATSPHATATATATPDRRTSNHAAWTARST